MKDQEAQIKAAAVCNQGHPRRNCWSWVRIAAEGDLKAILLWGTAWSSK